MCLQSVGCARGETDKTVIHIKSILEARQDGAGGSVGAMWRAGL